MKKTVTVYSDDPKTPRLVLTLSGELWVDVAAEPNRLAFGDMKAGEKVTQPLSLTITKPGEVRIEDVTVGDERFSIVPVSDEAPSREEPSPRDGSPKRYEVTFRGTGELGRVNDRVRITYEGPDGEGHVDVPLWGQVVGDLRYPNSLFLGKSGDSYETRKVVLSTRSGSPVRILGAKDPEGRLDVKILKAQGPRTELELSVAEGTAPTGALRGQIEIRTSDRLEPKVTIPYAIRGTAARAARPRIAPATKRGVLKGRSLRELQKKEPTPPK